MIFLSIGLNELLTQGISEAYEKLILGSILFIPGSYHTLLAVQALRGVEGWDYHDLTVFENDDFFDEDK